MRFSLEWREDNELADSDSFFVCAKVKRVGGAVATKSVKAILGNKFLVTKVLLLYFSDRGYSNPRTQFVQ